MIRNLGEILYNKAKAVMISQMMKSIFIMVIHLFCLPVFR